MLYTLLKSIHGRLARLIESNRALANKKRSERALEKLDDRLLDDIGLRRDAGGNIVSIRPRVHSASVTNKQADRVNDDRIINKRLYFARRRL